VQLGPIARARGVRILALDSVDSTNEEARRLIDSGERGPLWIVAAQQTKGRGRLGRDWVSPSGNFYGSFVHSDFSDVSVAPQLGFVTGVAVIRALREAAGLLNFQLKWPNDMLLERAKLGGILLECVSAGPAPTAIIGVGVNITNAPSDTPYPATALSATGLNAPTRESFFAHFSDTLAQTLDVWNGGEGFAAIRAEWMRHASGLGETIRVALANETLEGRFDSIDALGRLVLETTAGRRAIEAGDVLLGPRPVEARA
jgi:BirA family biotin operon repressor/biotin-[acetyl-CoA-carboxylase] ligase